MSVPLSDSTALVTGASSGIGRSVAAELGRRGARLAISARSRDRLEGLADELARSGAPRPIPIVADLAVPGSAHDVGMQALDQLGGVDILVNNAGGGVNGWQTVLGDRHEARDLFELNVWSPQALIAAVVPDMQKRRRGTVVNVTSMMQVMPWPTVGMYAASKAALRTLSDTLRLELASLGINVLEVVPGSVATPMQGDSMLIPGLHRANKRMAIGDPDELAKLIVKAIAAGDQRLVYPKSLRLGYALPGFVRRMAGRMATKVADDFDRDDVRVLVSGTNAASLAVRAAWEGGERDPSRMHEIAAAAETEQVSARRPLRARSSRGA
jgi:short-subunit dehydrogenase